MTTKIAVSLPDETVEHLRTLVREGKEPSVSAAVAAAVDRRRRGDDLAELIAEIYAESGGPPTEEERAQARRDLGLE